MNHPMLTFPCLGLKDAAGPSARRQVFQDEVQVWGFSLESDRDVLAWAQACLSPDERARAQRLVSGRHQREFMLAHGALRLVLSRYCGQLPQDLVFQKTASGKPFLPSLLSDHCAIQFNLTHSHGRAVIAVGNGREVGVDLEKIRPQVDVISLAKRFFSDQDQAFIEGGDLAQRHARFLQVWVAKEAKSKAEGTGITFPLHRDHVELSVDGTEGRLIRNGDGPDKTDIPIRFLPLDPGWVGAVAAVGRDWRVTLCG